MFPISPEGCILNGERKFFDWTRTEADVPSELTLSLWKMFTDSQLHGEYFFQLLRLY